MAEAKKIEKKEEEKKTLNVHSVVLNSLRPEMSETLSRYLDSGWELMFPPSYICSKADSLDGTYTAHLFLCTFRRIENKKV